MSRYRQLLNFGNDTSLLIEAHKYIIIITYVVNKFQAFGEKPFPFLPYNYFSRLLTMHTMGNN